jgi:hypothetical protein
MCHLIEPYDADSFVGYKIVLERDGEYYSLAMGFKYTGDIPTVEKQESLSNIFSPDLLMLPHLNHVGRTCAFIYLRDAQKLYNQWVNYPHVCIVNGYKLVIVKVRLTKGLMKGFYCSSAGTFNVIGGKHMEILE